MDATQPSATKPCKSCGTIKPLDGYHRNRHAKDGRVNDCKECAKARARKWAADNPERVKAYSQAWYAANKARSAEAGKAWRAANPEAHAEGRRRAKHKLKTERPMEYAVRHRMENRNLRVTMDEVTYGVALMVDPCSYCGGPAGEIDHIIPISAGGSNEWTNLTAACTSCNARKQRHSLLHALLYIKETP